MTFSLIIPTFNEAETIQQLIERIDQAFYLHQLSYEIIVIDDHSTDTTVEIIEKLKYTYPVTVFTKKGKIGKAYSLLEGFSQAKGEYVGFIDADLQYPPELLPFMIEECKTKADIIVAKRQHNETSLVRRVGTKSFQLIFGRILHHLPFDIQSGMKVFKREIIEKLDLNPKPWSFDLEFLVKAEKAGYSIRNFDIPFKKRRYGRSKKFRLGETIELASSALALKLRKEDMLTFSKNERKEKGNGLFYQQREFIHYSDLPLKETAFFQLTQGQKLDLFLLGVILIFSLFLNSKITLIVLLGIISLYYFIDLSLNLLIILISLRKEKKKSLFSDTSQLSQYPFYTILCPLYHEVSILPQFLESIENLTYPKDKLQVLLLLEEDDRESQIFLSSAALPSYVEVLVVPDSKPKTKPKACNFGLRNAKGEYIVIYDAEDKPEPDQLIKVVREFENQPDTVVCLQAKLSFYNSTQNILTRFFTAEYSLWFDLILPGLQKLNAPIPLGGTSNHFKTKFLREIGGWDSFNVTEDCDLGMRIARKGYKTAMCNSTTFEEANSHLFNWINQRSRWIKGYLQTYLVHTRSSDEIKNTSRFSFFLHFIVGGKVFSLFINPLMWALTVSYFLLRQNFGANIESFFPSPIFYIAAFSLLFGNFLTVYYYMLGLTKREEYSLIKYSLLIPVYWLMMSLAGVKGVLEMVTRPHHWAKTKHGLHLADNERDRKTHIFDPLEIPYIAVLPSL